MARSKLELDNKKAMKSNGNTKIMFKYQEILIENVAGLMAIVKDENGEIADLMEELLQVHETLSGFID